MHRRGRGRVGVVMLVAMSSLVGLWGSPAPAGAEDPLFVDWPSLLPSLPDAYNPSSANQCVAGKPRCVDVTIREMQRRFDPLARGCDHNAVFALAYLRTTQTYKWARNQPGFFADTPWVNHEDAVFAKYYFRAYDGWASGKRARVPRAWLIAFDAAAARRVTASGNLLLGMSAHVNRDLPFVLASIGITTPDGTTRKPDHNKVNRFLNAVVEPLLAEEAARFDPSIPNLTTPYGVGYTALFQQLVAWREQAWRNAEALTDAPDAATRALVAQRIEDMAAAEAQAIVVQNQYVPPATDSSARDAYCRVHFWDAAPMPYAFGMPTPG